MSNAPTARFTVLTLGVSDMRASIAFYESLGFTRKMRATGEEVAFFEVERSRAWVMTRRIAHTAHHRGQQTTLLRQAGRSLHSTYGPTADTGGLMQNKAPVVYAYPDIDTLVSEEKGARRKAELPGTGTKPVTERPG